jgi:ketosteroid isomerase-like protein
MTTSDNEGTDDRELPEVVSRYQAAHDRRDTAAALAAFAPDARVFDDGREYQGAAEIRDWLDHAASEYTFTRSLVSTEATGAGTWVVVNHLEGNFPGGVVDLRYRFTIADGTISDLVIAP